MAGSDFDDDDDDDDLDWLNPVQTKVNAVRSSKNNRITKSAQKGCVLKRFTLCVSDA
jgi:hypothetical protein